MFPAFDGDRDLRRINAGTGQMIRHHLLGGQGLVQVGGRQNRRIGDILQSDPGRFGADGVERDTDCQHHAHGDEQ